MYSKLPNLVLGFHGCDREVYDKVLYQHEHLNFSVNSYDWLGSGIYFWEQNLDRAWQWAEDSQKRGKIKEAAVIGAILDLGHCLNLLDSKHILEVKKEFYNLKSDMDILGLPMPENKNIKNNEDLLLRHLDCAVIESLHKSRETNNKQMFDSVRGLFIEGKELFPNSGFREKNHIQICVRNPNCIKGYFSPLNSIIDFILP